MRARVVEPSTEQILAYCAEDPVERVFLEDVARRGNGRFAGLERPDGTLQALCHLGTNVVPSGVGCGAFAGLAERTSPRMLIGEQAAVTAAPMKKGAALLEARKLLGPAAAVRYQASLPFPCVLGNQMKGDRGEGL